MAEKENEINLSSIDWSKLSSEEFQAISKRVNEMSSKRHVVTKKVSGSNKPVKVKIEGVEYIIPEKLYNRLVLLTSEKSKQNLIEEIKRDYQPFNENEIIRL